MVLQKFSWKLVLAGGGKGKPRTAEQQGFQDPQRSTTPGDAEGCQQCRPVS